MIQKSSTLFLKFSLSILGLAVLGLCILMFVGLAGEGIRDMSYFDRLLTPLVLTVWLTAIPFYIALYQSWKLLVGIDTGIAFSAYSVRALQNIKYCAWTISALYVASLPQFFILAEADDAPGVVVVGLILVGMPFTVATFAGVLQRLLQNAIDIKSENDLTV